MMNLNDYIITTFLKGIFQLPDYPQMTPEALKAWFDSRTDEIKDKLNGIINTLKSVDGAGNINVTAIEGLDGDTVQALLNSLKGLIDTLNIRTSNLDNTSDANKPISTETQSALDDLTSTVGTKANTTDVNTALSGKVDKITGKDLSTNDYDDAEKNKVTNATNHLSNTANPHSVTKAQVGLGNVDNTSDATKNSAVATLTNKSISGSNNTLSNISADSLAESATKKVFTSDERAKLAALILYPLQIATNGMTAVSNTRYNVSEYDEPSIFEVYNLPSTKALGDYISFSSVLQRSFKVKGTIRTPVGTVTTGEIIFEYSETCPTGHIEFEVAGEGSNIHWQIKGFTGNYRVKLTSSGSLVDINANDYGYVSVDTIEVLETAIYGSKIEELVGDTKTIESLASNTKYIYGALNSLTITATAIASGQKESFLFFTSKNETPSTTINFPVGLKMSGLDCSANVFTPKINKRYVIGFVHNGVAVVGFVGGNA